mmetsp:Transcript_19270/g.37782  ORF Transcript_19270/g.37782 Transcript_19270/m.37782 type:complete len:92 (+) Transcript_19270:205-480(+)
MPVCKTWMLGHSLTGDAKMAEIVHHVTQKTNKTKATCYTHQHTCLRLREARRRCKQSLRRGLSKASERASHRGSGLAGSRGSSLLASISGD